MVKISIIIPARNLWEMTKACIESIAHSCEKDALLDAIEVLVVNNNSSDATSTELAPTLHALFAKRGRHIHLTQNQSVAKACNAGARAAKGDLLFFLNNGTRMTEGCLPPLLHALERNPKLGMVGPLLLAPDNKVQHAGIFFKPNLELAHAHFLMPASYIIPVKQRFWQAITGAAMLIPRQLFRECEEFHEGYINGLEDLDLCCRVREKGYKLTVVHKSIIYHHSSQTTESFAHDSANTALLGQRCQGCFTPDQHIMAMEMGLEAKFSPDLEMYVGLPAAKEKAYNLIFTQKFDEKNCIARLSTDPYWLGGYEILATYYEKTQRWQDALDIRLQQTRLAPLVKHFASLAYCAANTGDTDIVSNGKQRLHDAARKVNNMDTLLRSALSLKDLALHNNDEALEKLLEQWIEQSHL